MNRRPCPAPPWPPVRPALNDAAAAPSPDGAGAAAVTDLSPLAKETVMPDSTDPVTGTHRPVVLKFNAHNHPVTVVADVAEAPRVHSTLDVSTLTARSMVQAGPVALIFDDPATAHLWAAAFSVLAADMEVNASHAADLRNTEMHAAADDHERAEL